MLHFLGSILLHYCICSSLSPYPPPSSLALLCHSVPVLPYYKFTKQPHFPCSSLLQDYKQPTLESSLHSSDNTKPICKSVCRECALQKVNSEAQNCVYEKTRRIDSPLC